MKKLSSKLSVNRETLRGLSNQDLAAANGAASTGYNVTACNLGGAGKSAGEGVLGCQSEVGLNPIGGLIQPIKPIFIFRP